TAERSGYPPPLPADPQNRSVSLSTPPATGRSSLTSTFTDSLRYCGPVDEVSMHPFTLTVNLFRGGSQRTQYRFGHSQSHFPLTREDILRPSPAQVRAFTHIGRASEDPDSRVQLPCQADHLGTGMQASSAENEAASAAYPGTMQDLAMACIAVDCGPALLRETT